MPLVRIDLLKGRTPEELRRLADTVQDVMLDVFSAPPRDRYQIITEHDKGHIIAEDTGLALGGGMRRTAGGFDHLSDVEQAFRLVLRSGPSPIRRRHFALADLGADPICLYKELTPRTEANTVLREPLCGAILISKESHE